MAREFAAEERTIKVTGEVTSDDEFQHGDTIYFVGRAVVHEVTFPEDKHGTVNRVHRVHIVESSAVDAENAERLIALQREKRTGQGDLIAEITRSEA